MEQAKEDARVAQESWQQAYKEKKQASVQFKGSSKRAQDLEQELNARQHYFETLMKEKTTFGVQLQAKDAMIHRLCETISEHQVQLEKKTKQIAVLYKMLQRIHPELVQNVHAHMLKPLALNANEQDDTENVEQTEQKPLEAKRSNTINTIGTSDDAAVCDKSTAHFGSSSTASTLKAVPFALEQSYRAQLDAQRDRYLARIHRLQTQLLEAERELNTRRDALLTDDQEIRQTRTAKWFPELSSQSSKHKGSDASILFAKEHTASAAELQRRGTRSRLLEIPKAPFQSRTRLVNVVIPGATATIRLPDKIRKGDLTPHVTFPATHLQMDPVTGSYTILRRNTGNQQENFALRGNHSNVVVTTLNTN